jgi:hypothetical protein
MILKDGLGVLRDQPVGSAGTFPIIGELKGSNVRNNRDEGAVHFKLIEEGGAQNPLQKKVHTSRRQAQQLPVVGVDATGGR